MNYRFTLAKLYHNILNKFSKKTCGCYMPGCFKRIPIELHDSAGMCPSCYEFAVANWHEVEHIRLEANGHIY